MYKILIKKTPVLKIRQLNKQSGFAFMSDPIYQNTPVPDFY